jgi:dTMP kinase
LRENFGPELVGESKGVLVDIEGVDAIGKRTQSSLITSQLRAKGIRCSTISFPDYNTAIGQEIKNYLAGKRDYSPQVGHMLYAVNRWEKKHYVEAMLADLEVLIVNRYSASNFAYGVARGLELEWLVNLEKGLPEPNLVLVLDAPPSTLVSRRGPKDRYERSVDFQDEVRRTYLELSKRFGWRVVNAAQEISSTNQLLMKEVSNLIGDKARESQ